MGRKQLKPIHDADSPAGVMATFLRDIYHRNPGLTLARLAAGIGYSQASVSEALSGKTMPSLDLVGAFVEGCGRIDARLEAEHVWRREKARSHGSIRPPHPDRVETWADLHHELKLLAHGSGLFTPKALCDAATEAGHPITHTSAHRWLTTPRPLRLDRMHTILNACDVPLRQREPWVRAHDRASNTVGTARTSLQKSTGPSAGALTQQSLLAELRRLSRGNGVQTPDLRDGIGPALRQLCDLTEFDSPETVRRKTSDWALAAARDLPQELQLAATTSLGLNPRALFRTLRERVEWLGEQQNRGAGTSRRRMDEAMARLAETALATRRAMTPASREHAWHVREFQAVLSLDGETPRCIENLTIVADRDGLDRITWSLTLARNEDGGPSDLGVKLLHGAQLLSQERPSPRRILLHLGLPKRLMVGEVHDFVLQVNVPTGEQMSPRYVYWPERRCERFRLVSRFGAQKPSAVWRVDHVFHRDADEIDSGRDYVSLDNSGEVQAAFAELQAGHGYGLRWTW